jgi:hypothetical protein
MSSNDPGTVGRRQTGEPAERLSGYYIFPLKSRRRATHTKREDSRLLLIANGMFHYEAKAKLSFFIKKLRFEIYMILELRAVISKLQQFFLYYY